ncbi:MAG: Thiol-disulfide oxidoreductase ResA [Myxococcota bacterium]|nr:Thiol-disulfide oxidoreductase ResA [Myxococcota bacterium]
MSAAPPARFMLEEGSQEKESVKRWFALAALLLLAGLAAWKVWDNARLEQLIEETQRTRSNRQAQFFQNQISQLQTQLGKSGAPQPAGFKPNPENRPAPDFDLSDRQGARFSLRDQRGKWVFLHFWFAACPPCEAEMPELFKLAGRLSGRNIELVAVSVDGDWTVMDDFWKSKTGGKVLPFRHLLDPEARVSSGFGTTKFPESWVIDPEGRIVARFVNRQDWDGPAARNWFARMLGGRDERKQGG